MGKSGLRSALVGLASWAAIGLAGLAAPSPASAAKPVCCFRVSIDVAGQVNETFSKGPNWQPGPGRIDAGSYDYNWLGSAYALSEWVGGTLQPIDSVAVGGLSETSTVHADDNPNPECTGQPSSSAQSSNPSGRLKKASKLTGLIQVDFSTGHHSTFTFGPPADNYRLNLNCGTDTITPEDLVNIAGDDNWSEQFFASSLIRGLSSRKLDEGQSEHVLCTGHAMRAGIGDDKYQRSVDGTYAYYINIVHVPAAEKKRNERRLKGLQNKAPKSNNPAERGLDNPNPPNGCKA